MIIHVYKSERGKVSCEVGRRQWQQERGSGAACAGRSPPAQLVDSAQTESEEASRAASLPIAKMLQQEKTGMTAVAMALESGNAGSSPGLSVMSQSLNLTNPWASHPI